MPKRNMTKFRIDEVAGVDVPAQESAVVAIMKRDSNHDIAAAKGSTIRKQDAALLTSESNGHQHGINHDHWDEVTYVAYGYGNGHEHTHPMTPDFTIGMSNGHSHVIQTDTIAQILVLKKETVMEPIKKMDGETMDAMIE